MGLRARRNFVQVCSYCKRVYGEKELLADRSPTHGICPECLPEVMADFERQLVKMGIDPTAKSKENPMGKKIKKSVYYLEGFSDGDSAYHDTDWQPGEKRKVWEEDSWGDVVGQILENWQQMAGTVYYQDLTDNQLNKWEEGFTDGFYTQLEMEMGGKK